MDAMNEDDAIGLDLDAWGGEETNLLAMPVRGAKNNGCPVQEDGVCPPGCVQCILFSMSQPFLIHDEGMDFQG